jgi:hypothetical protein
MNQIIRELKRQAAGEKLEPEQLKGLIRAGYVYRNDDEHFLTDKGRDALAQLRVQPGDSPPQASQSEPLSSARGSGRPQQSLDERNEIVSADSLEDQEGR